MALLAPFIVDRKGYLLKILIMLVAAVCLLSLLSRTVNAEKTYVITDGDAVKVHTSYTSDPEKALEEAGITLSDEDTYTTESVDGVSEITVQRAQKITVFVGKDTLTFNSYGETVGELFARMGIELQDGDVLSIPLDAQTYNGLIIRVNKTFVNDESYTLELPFETVYQQDSTLPVGVQKELTPGKAGQVLYKAHVTYRNLQETGRTVYEQTVLSQPVNRVVAIGTKDNPDPTKPIIGDGFILLPTGEVLTFTHSDQFVATAYTHTDPGCDEYTANGTKVKWGVVAIDPKVVPYGTRMFIVTNDGKYIYGLSTAEDCGGAIIGKRVDLYMPTDPECVKFGIRDCTIYFLGGAKWRDLEYQK